MRNAVNDFLSTPDLPLAVANPLAGATLQVPVEARLNGQTLLWKGLREGRRADGVLWEFARLADASEEEIAAFALEYGVIGIRNDGMPSSAPDHWPFRTDIGLRYTDDLGEGTVVEDLRIWRAYAIGIKGVLSIAMALRDNPDADPTQALIRDGIISSEWKDSASTWQEFGLPLSTDGVNTSPEFDVWAHVLDPMQLAYNVAHAGPGLYREALTFQVNRGWFPLSGLGPILTWEQGDPHMTLDLGTSGARSYGSPNLFSVLVAQMAAVVTAPDFERLAACSACGEYFSPLVKPGRHERVFCPRHKADAKRERKREWARKKAAERRAATES